MKPFSSLTPVKTGRERTAGTLLYKNSENLQYISYGRRRSDENVIRVGMGMGSGDEGVVQ